MARQGVYESHRVLTVHEQRCDIKRSEHDRSVGIGFEVATPAEMVESRRDINNQLAVHEDL